MKAKLIIKAAALVGILASGFAPLQLAAQSSGDQAGPRLEVRGVLISERSRSALVNGSLVREGERVADAQVLEISEHEVRLGKNGYELSILVGGSGSWAHANPISKQTAVVSIVPTAAPPEPPKIEQRSDHHTVASGETLSTIAERHLVPGATLRGTMEAIYQANPHAFYGNIHQLRAGATIELPTLLDAPPHDATDLLAAVEPSAPDDVYGPVRDGESLSSIAESLPNIGYSPEQLMLALFTKNPHAFGGNINLLYSGATLRLPEPVDIGQRTPVAAAAEIQRQMTSWNERAFSAALPHRAAVDFRRQRT